MSENGETDDVHDVLLHERDGATERLKKAPHAYRTISEVADELHVPQHVLRFWETRFPEVKPLKRGGGRRYYRPEDVDVLRNISDLLYVQGYTIKGVQRVLRETTPSLPVYHHAETAEGENLQQLAEATPDRTNDEHIVFPRAPAESQMAEEFSAEPLKTDETEAENLDDRQEMTDSVFYEIEEEEIAEVEVIEDTAQEPVVLVDPALVAAVERLEAERALLRTVLRDVLDELDGIRRMLPVS